MPHIVDFRKPETLDEVARFLGLTSAALAEAIAAGKSPSQHSGVYVQHRIPKKRGGPGRFRIVWEVVDAQIRDAHRAFAWRFEDFARNILTTFPHRAAYGYIRKRSIKDNAEQHAGHKVLLRCDLKDFFPTIGKNRLVGQFVQIGIHATAAEVLADFVTIEEKLALGLNGSPMLANLVCVELDKKLEELAAEFACTYTRYADDIAMSGNEVPPGGRVAQIVEGEGFRLSEKKMRVTKLGQAHFVTGLSVSDSRAPHVPRRFKKRLRQELYYCSKFGIQGHLARLTADGSYQKGINRLDGSVRFLSSIEPEIGGRMREIWRRAMIREGANVSYAPVYERAGVDVTFFIDETEFRKDGKNFLAVACVTSERPEIVRSHVEATLRRHLIDPFSEGRKKDLERRGLHFVDAPESLKTEYILLLPYMQFRAYIAFGEMAGVDSYRPLYARLLGSLLPRRFKSCDRSRVTVLAEQNSRIPAAEISHVVSAIYRDLEKRNERRPVVTPSCAAKSKQEEAAFSLPDCLLWVFARTFSGENAKNVDYKRFERLRDKYRHIVNVDTGEVFSRRHPIEMRKAADSG